MTHIILDDLLRNQIVLYSCCNVFASISSSILSEHTTALCKSYEDKHSALQDRLKATSLRRKCFSLFCPFQRRRRQYYRGLHLTVLTQWITVSFCPVMTIVGRLDAVSWRVDYTLSSSELQDVNEPLIKLKLQCQGAMPGSSETKVFSVSADKFRVLLAG